jgi:hypothetical protein
VIDTVGVTFGVGDAVAVTVTVARGLGLALGDLVGDGLAVTVVVAAGVVGAAEVSVGSGEGGWELVDFLQAGATRSRNTMPRAALLLTEPVS